MMLLGTALKALFRRHKPPAEQPESAATLVAAYIDADVDCTRWKKGKAPIGRAYTLFEPELHALVSVDYVYEKVRLHIGEQQVPMNSNDRRVLRNAYRAWGDRWDEAERQRLLHVTAAAIKERLSK